MVKLARAHAPRIGLGFRVLAVRVVGSVLGGKGILAVSWCFPAGVLRGLLAFERRGRRLLLPGAHGFGSGFRVCFGVSGFEGLGFRPVLGIKSVSKIPYFSFLVVFGEPRMLYEWCKWSKMTKMTSAAPSQESYPDQDDASSYPPPRITISPSKMTKIARQLAPPWWFSIPGTL